MAIDALNNRSLDGLKEPVATAKPAAPKASVLTGEKVSTAEVAEKATDAVMLTDTAKTLAESVANKLIDSEDELSSIFG